MKAFTMLLKRESWEHPALWIVPAVFAALLVVGMAYGLFTMWRMGVPTNNVGIELSKIAEIAAEDRRQFISTALLGMVAPFGFFLAGLLFFYGLDSLYADRRDRSILFWKSMPVSDVQTVFSKLAMIVVVAPLMTLAVAATFQLVTLVFASIVGLWFGMEGWYLAWDPLAIARTWALMAWVGFGAILAFLPFLAWTLLASAWAKKAAFLWATVPPVAIIVVENMAYSRSYFGAWLLRRFTDTWPLIVGEGGRGARIELENGGTVNMGGFVTARFDLFTSALFWEGMVIAAVFIAAAIWLRRYRAEAE